MLTFTYLSTSNISDWLIAFFLAFSSCGKGGRVLFFTKFSLIASSSGSVSFAFWPYTGMGFLCTNDLLLRPKMVNFKFGFLRVVVKTRDWLFTG